MDRAGLAFGLTFPDLADRDGLVRLDRLFVARLEADAPALHARLTADGIDTSELTQLPDFVVFRCRDLDGYQLEVYWE